MEHADRAVDMAGSLGFYFDNATKYGKMKLHITYASETQKGARYGKSICGTDN